jgi:hypothetical protein
LRRFDERFWGTEIRQLSLVGGASSMLGMKSFSRRTMIETPFQAF